MTTTLAGGGAEDLPEWYRPPQMIGGHAAGTVLFGRTDRCVVAVRQVLAYPVGIEVVVEAHTRGFAPEETTDFPSPPWLAQPGFRIRFADGRESGQGEEAGLRTGLGPMLSPVGSEHSSGGPDNGEDIRLSLWIWPLPPAGPVTLTCRWPERGLPEAEIVLDGAAIRAAADLAEPFWLESGS